MTLAIFLAASAQLWSQSYLDLTDRSRTRVGIPGMHTGGIGGVAPKRTTLPLKITIQDVAPVVLKDRDDVTLVMTVHNTGSEAVEIPAEEHFDRIVKPGNQNQRQMTILLRFTSPDLPKPFELAVGGSAGSSSVPGSLTTLAPGDTMTIRVAGQIPIREAVSRLAPGVDSASFAANAVLSEYSLDSDAYIISDSFPEVVSTNSVSVFWRKGE